MRYVKDILLGLGWFLISILFVMICTLLMHLLDYARGETWALQYIFAEVIIGPVLATWIVMMIFDKYPKLEPQPASYSVYVVLWTFMLVLTVWSSYIIGEESISRWICVIGLPISMLVSPYFMFLKDKEGKI